MLVMNNRIHPLEEFDSSVSLFSSSVLAAHESFATFSMAGPTIRSCLFTSPLDVAGMFGAVSMVFMLSGPKDVSMQPVRHPCINF